MFPQASAAAGNGDKTANASNALPATFTNHICLSHCTLRYSVPTVRYLTWQLSR